MGFQKYKKLSLWLITIEVVATFTIILIGHHTFGKNNDILKTDNTHEVKNSKITKKDKVKEIVGNQQEEMSIDPSVSNEIKIGVTDHQKKSNVTANPSNPTSTTQSIAKPITKTTQTNLARPKSSSSIHSTIQTTTVPAPETATPSTTPVLTVSPTTSTETATSEPTNTPGDSTLPKEEQSPISDMTTVPVEPGLSN